MAKARERVPVIRVSRAFINNVLPNEIQDDIGKDTSMSYSKPYQLPHGDKTHNNKRDKTHPNDEEQHIENTKNKTELFTLTVPRASNVKNDDYNEPSQTSITIQRQPGPVDSWVKRSPENENRPSLNWKATGTWSNGFCSLFDDFNMCCYACTCWCCFRHELSTMMDEHWLLWFINCTPLMELRTKFRQQYAIRGSIAEDCCLSTCCPLCVALQLANEGRHYGHHIFC